MNDLTPNITSLVGKTSTTGNKVVSVKWNPEEIYYETDGIHGMSHEITIVNSNDKNIQLHFNPSFSSLNPILETYGFLEMVRNYTASAIN